MASTIHSVRTMSCTSTRWNAPRCGDARHLPHHALPLRTVKMLGAPGGRDLPSATVHRMPGAGRLRSGSGRCQGKTSKDRGKLVAGQGLLSTRWTGWNPRRHTWSRGCIECTPSDAPSPSVCTPQRAGGSGGHCHTHRAAHRCGGDECTAWSAREPVRPMYRTNTPDAGVHSPTAPVHRSGIPRWAPPWSPLPEWTPFPTQPPIRARVRRGIHRAHSSPAAAPRGAPRVRPTAGVLPGAVPGGWRRR